jgi:hypothetical protein
VAGHVVTSGADQRLCVLEPSSLRVVSTHVLPDFPYSLAGCGGAAVCGCGDGAVVVIDVAEGRQLRSWKAAPNAIRCTLANEQAGLVCAGDDGRTLHYAFS